MSSRSTFIYEPKAPWIQSSHIQNFIHQHKLRDFSELLHKSQEDVEWFWTAALKDMNLEFSQPYESLLQGGLPWPRWAVGGKLNPTELCIDRHLSSRANQTAIDFEADEEGQSQSWTFQDLARESSYVCRLLKEAGAQPGDRAALLMPMSLEMCASFFGIWRAGLTIIPIFSGYGEEAILARLQDASVKFVFVQSRTTRRGKEIPVAETARRLAAQCSSVKKVFEFDREDFLKGHRSQEILPSHDFEAEDECLILYTSGTTGKPKGCVHTPFGVLATTGKELRYAFDVKESDRFFWYTDIGWMMGPWELIGCLQFGAAVVLYEGVPNFPDSDRLWRILKRYRVTHLGISPTAVRVLKKEETGFLSSTEFPDLRILGSTGEPWDEESWLWYFRQVGRERCPIINISGGTEIMGCLLSPTPLHPLKPTSLASPGLGVKLGIWSEEGQEVSSGIGHLVCLTPLPSMTKGFLNSRERYLETYFSKFGPNVWYHGDWAFRDEDGLWFLKGRSDDTIKVAGKRVGPNEFESALMEDPRVQESAAVGIPHEIKGEGVYCFVVMKAAEASSQEELETSLKLLVQKKMGKALAPERIIFCQALPKTRSGKILRSLLKKLVLKEDVDASAAENPESLQSIQKILLS